LEEAARRTAAQFRYKTGAYYDLWIDGEKAVTALEPEVPADEVETIYGDTYLPRKFKFGFAWPGDNCIDVYSQDVGVVPWFGDANPHAPAGRPPGASGLVPGQAAGFAGYVVLAGGGLGLNHAREHDTYPRLATPFFLVPPELLGPVAEAIVTTQRDFGDRQDRQRARLKYTIDERGEDWFRAEVAARVGQPLEAAPALPPWRDSDDHVGWFEQPDGRWFLGVHVDSGRVVDRDGLQVRSALREVVDTYGTDVRLTTRQDVLLCGLEQADRAGVDAILRRRGVPSVEQLRPVRRLAMACPALPTCGQALGEAERVLPQVTEGIQHELDRRDLGELPIRVNLTGCPNGCARPYVAEVGIVGRTKTAYDVYVGGSAGGDRLAARIAAGVGLALVPAALGPLLER
jgi:sulfite reductase (ferredoxin)